MTPPAASAVAAPAIHPRRTTGPRRAPAAPRRRSGPARPSGHAHPTRGPARAVGIAEAVATHRLLDRLIRGRIWIGVIAFALIGIVTMQLVLLKVNAGIGRSLVREALLQRENATLSAENSEAAAGEQIEAQAARDGMEPIPAGALRFLSAHPASDVGKAVAALNATATTSAAGSDATSGTSTEAQAGAEATSGTTGAGEATAAGATPAAGTTGASAESEAANAAAGATPEATGQSGTTSQAPSSGAGATTSATGGAGEAVSPSQGAATAAGGGTGG
jgi:hypothetical protein